MEAIVLPLIKHDQVLPLLAVALRAHLDRGNWEVLIQWVDSPASDAT